MLMLNVKALEVIKTALSDNWVRTGRRYSLFQRAQKICQSAAVRKSSQNQNLWQDFASDCMNDVNEPQSVNTITAFRFILFFGYL